MAEEADVDIEGDETPEGIPGGYYEGAAGSLEPDPYLDSTWQADHSFLPWTLDSSISEENRAVIEKMLLEEQYYSSNKLRTEKFTPEPKESVRKTFKRERSAAGSPLKWTTEEKDLFDQGLAKFGRRWTRIAKMIGSRTVMQVKSYARHYLKNKIKSMEPAKEETSHYNNVLYPFKEKEALTWQPVDQLGCGDPKLNAVKIQQLSDDEEVDITDEVDELFPSKPPIAQLIHVPIISPKEMVLGDHIYEIVKDDELTLASQECLPLSQKQLTRMPVFETPENAFHTKNLNVVGKKLNESLSSINCEARSVAHDNDHQLLTESPTNQSTNQELCQIAKDLRGNEMPLIPSCQLQEGDDEEEEELKPPDQEVELDKVAITEEEKQAIPEFFEGRPAKTPDRYLKIRNHILEQWEKCRPKFLNKTSVRSGLKNCGDVNCIGRIHTYLELIGAINFGCEQCIYNRPRPVERARAKEGEDGFESYQLAQRLQSMRIRRRRVRDSLGNWCDARDLEGQTFEHLSAEELAKRHEEEKRKPSKGPKGPKQIKSSFDPFQLIPCCSFNEEKQEPFQVKIAAEALLIMDLHAHVSMAEVIGLLGGRYSESDSVLEICAAEPCNSLSTGLQCEMDPVSQTQASETLAVRGYSVIGWYHSHPAFDPNPSIRDIDTQAKYQSYFSRGGAVFIGVIISPYNRNNPVPFSQINCLVISDDRSTDGSHRMPFKFEMQQMLEEPQYEVVFSKTKWIIEKYRLSHSCVPMSKIFRRDSCLTCLQKLLACLRKTLDKVTNRFIAEEFLTQIEHLFLTHYKSDEEGEVAEDALFKEISM